MDRAAASRSLISSLPLSAAGVSAAVVAAAFLMMPGGLLEGAVTASGIPAIVAAAEPPLGITARIVLGIAFGAIAAGFVGTASWLLGGGTPGTGFAKWLKHRDVHPDAPLRAPLFANRDLGSPDRVEPRTQPLVERDLPADLEQPLSAFDPGAIPAIPLPAPEQLRPLSRPQLFDPGDRFETFELTPLQRIGSTEPVASPLALSSTQYPHHAPSLRVPPAGNLRTTALREDSSPVHPSPVVTPETAATVHDLLARLERSVARRPVVSAGLGSAATANGLEAALGDLRRLAVGGR